MIHIDAKSVIETRIAESMGFDKYKKIMDWVRRTDVSRTGSSNGPLIAFIASEETKSGGGHTITSLKK